MIRWVKTALLGLAVSLGSFASCPEIAGYWNSTTGNTVNICYPGNPDTFTIQLFTPQGGSMEATAQWMEGFRIQFCYHFRNRQFMGVYDPQNDTIQVSDEDGKVYWWTR